MRDAGRIVNGKERERTGKNGKERERTGKNGEGTACMAASGAGRMRKWRDRTPPPRADTPDLSHIAESLRPLAYPLSDLAFMVGNAVRHPEKQMEEITASLERFGQVEPLVVNRRPVPHVVLGGNGRLQALLALGKTHAAVAFVDLDEAAANMLSLALNRTADGREWDKEALDKLLREVSTEGDKRLGQMLADLAQDVGSGSAREKKPIRELKIKPPPEMVWVLIGVRLDRFGEVQHHVAALQEASDVSVQSNRD